jgi:hypothetical protein
MSSPVVAPDVIDGYGETSGAVRSKVMRMNHNQPRDPQKLAAAMLTLVDAPNPPLRLSLRTVICCAIAAKNGCVTQ